MKKIIIAMIMLLMITAVTAQENTTEPAQVQTDNEICSYMKEAFVLGGELPSYIPYGNEVINGFDMNENPAGTIVTEDGKLKEITCIPQEEPSYILHVDSVDTIREIRNSEKPMKALDKAMSEDRITIEGTSFGKDFKGFFTRIAVTVGGWFG